MKEVNVKIFILLILLSGSMVAVHPAFAENNISLVPEINIVQDCDQSEAELILRIHIPEGATLGSEAALVERVMNFYRELWSGEAPILKKITPENVDVDLEEFCQSTKAVLGVDTIMEITRSFQAVSEKGLTSFPEDTTIIIREKFPLYFDCLLNGNQDGGTRQAMQAPRIVKYKDVNRSNLLRKSLERNLSNLAVSLISFRSEFSRFPVNITELNESGHMLQKMSNPYDNTLLKFKGECGPGTMQYSRPSEGRFVITIFDDCNIPIRRELVVGRDNTVKGLLSYDKPAHDDVPFTNKEQTVRIYVFQIGQMLNSFYETYQYLPRSISHMESQGFASLNYINPYTSEPIKPSMKMSPGSPGNYMYMLIGEGEYLLVGFGENGRKVLEVHRKFIGRLD